MTFPKLICQTKLISGNTEILTQNVRKTKYFKELFNEQRNKDTRSV